MWQVKHFTTLDFAAGPPSDDTQDSGTCDNVEMGPVDASYGRVQMRESQCSIAENGLRVEAEGYASTSTRYAAVESPIQSTSLIMTKARGSL